jgi:hypothetical protein
MDMQDSTEKWHATNDPLTVKHISDKGVYYLDQIQLAPYFFAKAFQHATHKKKAFQHA